MLMSKISKLQLYKYCINHTAAFNKDGINYIEGAAAGDGKTHFELLQLSVFVQVLNHKTN